MPKEKLTPEQKKENKLKSLEEILTNNLYQNVIGSTTLKRDPHEFGKFGYELGKTGYSEIMNTEDAQKMASKESEREKEQLGISETAPASYYVERKVREMVRGEAFQGLPLGRIENTVKSVIPDLDFELDDKFKDYIPREVMIEAAKKQEQGKELSEEETYVLRVHQYLQDKYENYLALSYQSKSYVEQANAQGKALNQDYEKAIGKVKEEKPREKGK